MPSLILPSAPEPPLRHSASPQAPPPASRVPAPAPPSFLSVAPHASTVPQTTATHTTAPPDLATGITAAESYRISVAFRELDGEKLKAETALRPGYTPGDLGFDPLGLAPEDPAEFALMQEKELAHARVAMVAAAGFLAQEAITKQTWGTAIGLPDF